MAASIYAMYVKRIITFWALIENMYVLQTFHSPTRFRLVKFHGNPSLSTNKRRRKTKHVVLKHNYVAAMMRFMNTENALSQWAWPMQ